ncbi:hypothetical protein IR151_17450 [Clostridioides sp. ES-S-0006-03]|uniref:pentapeptide repeat-containing protein n=1 Tax=Clostridioides sp. ES-S-0006-03 TaxID=2770775 RepID=UPI001D0C3DB3|nr:hypothetical protein [Clostridioides sp. ES-S-0006-03]
MNRIVVFYDNEDHPVFQVLVRNVKKYTRKNIIVELVEDYIENNTGEIDLKDKGICDIVSWEVFTITDTKVYNLLFDLKLDYDSLIDNKNNVDTRDCNTEDSNIGSYNKGDCNTGHSNTGDRNTGHGNKGDCNTGYNNTGNWNTGDYNMGSFDTGDRNTGNWNTGNDNRGNRNSGHDNIGDDNTGYCNVGNWNTGNYNIGKCNTGEWNIGDYNTGIFCTDVPKIRMFNKETDLTYEDWMNSEARNILKRNSYLEKWIHIDDMTEEEKENNPEYLINHGYLKVFSTFKEMYKDMWDSLTEEEKKIIMDIPNFDADIFKEITGIEVKIK